MALVGVDINQLNRAIIMVGSRAELANSIGKAPSYISHVISSGEMEEEEAEHIAKRFNIDVILGDTRVLGTEVVPEPKAKPTKYTKISPHDKMFDEFVSKFCVKGKQAECLFSDMFNTYLIYAHSVNDLGMSKDEFTRKLIDGFKVQSEKAVVSKPFDYIPRCMNYPYHFVPQRRLVIKGMTLNKDALNDLIEKECVEWVNKTCVESDGMCDIRDLQESFNDYHADKIKYSFTYFKMMLTFLGFQLACESGSNCSSYCRGLMPKSDYKKKAVVDDLYGIKKEDLTLRTINPTSQEVSVMEQLLAEQRRTNDLLVELISIWK